jgi:hypothetical protein
MSKELDLILVDQLISARHNLKTLKRLKRMLQHDEDLDFLEEAIKNRIKLFEFLIEDKKLLKKKKINLVKTLSKVVYVVRIIYQFRHYFIKRGNK